MAKKVRLSVEGAMEAAIELHKRGDLDEAGTLYDDILKVAPTHADALHYKGVIQHQLGEPEVAIKLIKKALKQVPGYPDALNNLGNIMRETGRLEEAMECYTKVLEFAPEHVDTLVNMAIVHRGLKDPAKAQEYLKTALDLDPEHAMVWHNLGNVYRDLKLFDQAIDAYTKSDALAPLNDDSSKEIAKILYRSGRASEAVEVLSQFLKRKPNDEIAKHMIAAFGGADVPDRASDRFVTQTFDTFSTSFDESLARLEYKAPRLVGDEVLRLAENVEQNLDILDIGCGTGLCGPIVKSVSARLVGVDLSPGMLRKAKHRKSYDELHEAELTAFMQSSDSAYDVIICVDTFVYFGKLDEALAAASKILNAGGHAIFTVERHEQDECSDDYRLQHHGRYSHTDAYLDGVLAGSGFDVLSLTPIVPRMEGGKPVNGTLAVARKAK